MTNRSEGGGGAVVVVVQAKEEETGQKEPTLFEQLKAAKEKRDLLIAQVQAKREAFHKEMRAWRTYDRLCMFPMSGVGNARAGWLCAHASVWLMRSSPGCACRWWRWWWWWL